MEWPGLRERGEDVVLFLDHFLHLFSTKFGKRIRGYSPQARQILEASLERETAEPVRTEIEASLAVA